jgi:hypothetical protein
MPFIVGSPRSGTTLLRFMLDAHPELAIPPETGFLRFARELEGEGQGEEIRGKLFALVVSFPPSAPAWEDFGISSEELRKRLEALDPFTVADGVRLFYRMYAERFDKPRWGDKTPLHCREMPWIEELLPEAHFIHLVRDGRDASLSLRRTWFSPGSDVETLARYWLENVEAAREGGAAVRHFLEVRYEDLVAKPEPVLRRICDFLDLAYRDEMLRYPERAALRLAEHRGRQRADGSILLSQEERLRQQSLTRQSPVGSRVGVWEREMGEEEVRRFEAIAGERLAAYGYRLARRSRL